MPVLPASRHFPQHPPVGDMRPPARPGAALSAVGSSTTQTVLVTAALAVGISVVIGFYALWSRPVAGDRWLLAIALMAPAIGWGISGSSLLIDHLLMIVVLNRLLRRLLDWGEGRFDPLPVLSLLPLVTTVFMLPTIITHWYRMPARMRQAGGLFMGAMIYATGLGFSRNGLPALYACAEWVTPLTMMYFCIAVRPSAAVLHRWLTVLITLGVVGGVYGIYQWYSLPPWDAKWLLWSGMASSMGGTKAFEFSICSTLESRGPAAFFFMVVTAVIAGLPTFRRRGGLLLAVVPATALLLTRARTGLIYLLLTLVVSALLAGRRGGLKTILGVCVLGGITAGVLSQQEQSDAIFDRVATLGSVTEDGSANVRVGITQRGVTAILNNPLGVGFGAIGNATKAGGSDQDQVGDNGYIEIIATLGVPGAALFFAGLVCVVSQAFANRDMPTAHEPATHLGLGMVVGLLPVLVIGNVLTTAHGGYVWILLARHLGAIRKRTSPPRPVARGVMPLRPPDMPAGPVAGVASGVATDVAVSHARVPR